MWMTFFKLKLLTTYIYISLYVCFKASCDNHVINELFVPLYQGFVWSNIGEGQQWSLGSLYKCCTVNWQLAAVKWHCSCPRQSLSCLVISISLCISPVKLQFTFVFCERSGFLNSRRTTTLCLDHWGCCVWEATTNCTVTYSRGVSYLRRHPPWLTVSNFLWKSTASISFQYSTAQCLSISSHKILEDVTFLLMIAGCIHRLQAVANHCWSKQLNPPLFHLACLLWASVTWLPNHKLKFQWTSVYCKMEMLMLLSLAVPRRLVL